MKCIKEIRKQNNEHEQQMNRITQANEKLKLEVQEVKQKMEKMEESLEQMEKAKRRKYLIIKGIDIWNDDKEVVKQYIETFLKEKVEVDVKIETVRRLNDKICLIGMKKVEEKIDILKNKNRLRNYKEQTIFIASDLTYKEREMQRFIRERAAVERKNGNNVKIGYNYIIVQNIKWRWSAEKKTVDKERTEPKN